MRSSATHIQRPDAAEGRPTGHAGFTIIELMVTVSIIVLLIVLTIPVLSVLQNGTRESAGYNTVAVAASAARQLATASTTKTDPLTGTQPFKGTAVLFDNTGEIRIMEHDQSGSYTWQNVPNAATPAARKAVPFTNVVGRDYIGMPSRVGIVGVARGASGINGLRLLAPPFALRFNEHGSLIYGGTSTDDGAFNVYVDADDDGTINGSLERPANYNPASSTNKVWNASLGGYQLPYEGIETVVAVIVFPLTDNIDLLGDSNGYVNATARDEILDAGRVVFFSRYTGAPLRMEFQ